MTDPHSIPDSLHFPKAAPREQAFGKPLSQAEDSTQTSGSEPRSPGTARPRVRNRENRPGFHL